MLESVQLEMLKECIQNRVPVTVFLMNGFQLHGVIKNFDISVVLLETDGKQQMIYKHAISTIVPAKQLKTTVWQ